MAEPAKPSGTMLERTSVVRFQRPFFDGRVHYKKGENHTLPEGAIVPRDTLIIREVEEEDVPAPKPVSKK